MKGLKSLLMILTVSLAACGDSQSDPKSNLSSLKTINTTFTGYDAYDNERAIVVEFSNGWMSKWPEAHENQVDKGQVRAYSLPDRSCYGTEYAALRARFIMAICKAVKDISEPAYSKSGAPYTFKADAGDVFMMSRLKGAQNPKINLRYWLK